MRSWRADERGVSLVELIVFMGVASVVLLGVTSAAIGTFRGARYVDVHTADQGQARTAIAAMTRDIRAAAPVRPTETPAVLVAEPFEMQFTANLDTSTRPVLVTISLQEDGRVLETVADPNPGDLAAGVGWDTGNQSVRYITSFVVNEGNDEAMIRYFDRQGDELGPQPGGLTVEQRRTIAAVELELMVSGDASDRTSRFTVASRIRLPNNTGHATDGGS